MHTDHRINYLQIVILLQAYRNSLANNNTLLRLPGIDLTPDQLFFVAFSQVSQCMRTNCIH